jgi:hypothetical protein
MVNKISRDLGREVGREVNTDSGEAARLGNVGFAKAPMNAGGAGGSPTKSRVNDGINKPMGDGMSKPATQWTKRS